MTLLVAAPLLITLQARASEPEAGTDRMQIQQLTEQFKGAILAKDGAALRGMFLPGGSWLQGLDKASMAKLLAKHPEAKQFMPGNYEQFAKFVSEAPKPIEETFRNLRIETDGTVGTVYFDYQFLADGKVQNHGVETWQLVHTKDGWKISAMLYSVIMDGLR
jgi:hypothetical protein